MLSLMTQPNQPCGVTARAHTFLVPHRFRPQVPPTMDYLEEIVRSGARIIDVSLIALLPTIREIRVYLEDGKERVYYMEGAAETIMTHFRQAVEFSGFGPRGLGNLIHADVMQQVRDTGKKQEQFDVWVSQECLNRINSHVEPWTRYGYKILVSPAMTGMTYAIRDKGQPPDLNLGGNRRS